MTENLYPAILMLDEMSQNPPPSDMSDLHGILENPALDQYFFSKLDRSDWISSLNEHGFFTQERLNLRPSRLHYLSSIASQNPSSVINIINGVGYLTSVDSRRNLVRVLKSLPAETLTPLLPRIPVWLYREQDLLVLHEFIGLISNCKDIPDVNDYAGFLIRFLLMPWIEEEYGKENQVPDDIRIKTHLSDWHYSEFLRKECRSFKENIWHGPLLVDVLAEFAKFRELDGDERSYYNARLRSLDSGSQFGHNDPDDSLIQEIVSLGRESETTLTFALLWSALSKYPYSVFKRISLDMLAHAENVPQDILTTALLDKYALEQIAEYEGAAKRHFRALLAKHQDQIITWLTQEPMYWNWGYVSTLQESDRQKARERWQWRVLNKFAPDDLPEPLKVKIAELNQLHDGPPKDNGIVFRSWVGHPTTLKIDDLKDLSVSGVAAFLEGDPPSTGNDFSDDLEARRLGVAEVLRRDVADRPQDYFNEIGALQNIHPTYKFEVLFGLRNLASPIQGSLLSFINSFDLSRVEGETSPFYSSTIASLCDLLEDKILKDPAMRQQVQAAPAILDVIAQGLKDSDPPQDADIPNLKNYGDSYTRSLNINRGKAMHALLRFMGWMQETESHCAGVNNAEQLSNAKNILKDHILSGSEGSSAVYSAIVPSLPWLHYTDYSLFQQIAPTLFDRTTPYISSATWETHLQWNKFYSNLFGDMRPMYVTHISEDLSDSPSKIWLSDDNGENFAEHIIIFYARGRVNFSDEDRLIQQFFSLASHSSVKHLLSFIGRAISNDEDSSNEVVKQRLIDLWNYIRSEVVPTRADHAEFLGGFDEWFTGGQFEETWSLVQMQYVLENASSHGSDYLVINRLKSLALKYPLEVANCIYTLLEKNRLAPYEVFQLREILDEIKDVRNPELDQVVNLIIERILAIGFIEEFRIYHR